METLNNDAAAAAEVAEPKRKQPRATLNQVHLRKLKRAESVVVAAVETSRAPRLALRDISESFVDNLRADTQAARAKAAAVVHHSTAGQTSTVEEGKAARALLAALQEVQIAARQKYSRTNRVALADYFIGRKLNGSQPNLLQTSQTIITRLETDVLPGITAAKVKNLGTLRQAWIDASNAQGEAVQAAQTARAELKTLLHSIGDRRIAIQLAADAEWPYFNEGNAAVRRDFSLPARRPYKA